MSIFNKISLKRPKRTVHNLSYSSKLTLPFGRLCPMFCEKVVPGDKFIVRDEFMMRFAPFVNQVFQGYQVRTEYFFVPSRLLWKNFEMFLSDGLSGTNTDYVHPYLNYKHILARYTNSTPPGGQSPSMVNSIFDYFNLPTDDYLRYLPENYAELNWDGRIDVLPFYAYCKIFLDYYAEENLDYLELLEHMISDGFTSIVLDGDNTDDFIDLFAILNGADTPSPLAFPDLMRPLFRSYPKDYFTSALPWAQRGPVITIPMDGEGDVNVFADGVGKRYSGVGVAFSNPTATQQEVSLYHYGGPEILDATIQGGDGYGAAMSSHLDSEYDLNLINEIGATASQNPITFKAVNINGTATITDLRTAMTVQAWLEKRARGGARPKEQIYSSFGVKSRDFRLDRAELLYSSKNTVSIGEVFTTAANKDSTFVAGMGVSNAKASAVGRGFKHFFEEHGYVIGLMSVFPNAEYFQGVPRQFLELDKLDYYWPEFQNIGEQQIYNCELMLSDDSNPLDTFGYTPRYAHYKTRLNQIHGDFRTSLNFMHAARAFDIAPKLNNEFVQIIPEKDDLYRTFNLVNPIGSALPVYCDLFHDFKAIRPMQYFGSPRII